MPIQTPLQYIREKRSLATSRKPSALAKITTRPYINPQCACPLFTRLPTEVRTLIFHHALLGHPNPSKPYSRHTYYYRPGFTHARSIAVALLLTCRRIYLETHLLPLILNTHVLWQPAKRGPPAAKPYLLPHRMKTFQRDAVRAVHIFAQQFWLEDWNLQWLAYSRSWPGGHPGKLRITIRHTDWWYYLLGENSPLALNARKAGRATAGARVERERDGDGEVGFEEGSWGSRFREMKGLKCFELELETLVGKKDELEEIVGAAGGWVFGLGDEGVALVMDEEATERMEWTGSKNVKGLPGSGEERAGLGLLQGRGLGGRRESEAERGGGEDTLDYYVVTMVWRAQSVPREALGSNEEEGPAQRKAVPATVPAIAPAVIPNTAMVNGVRRPMRRDAIPTYFG